MILDINTAIFTYRYKHLAKYCVEVFAVIDLVGLLSRDCATVNVKGTI